MLSSIGAALLRLVARLGRQDGQALADYSLILAFVFVACIIAVGALGVAITGPLDVTANAFP